MNLDRDKVRLPNKNKLSPRVLPALALLILGFVACDAGMDLSSGTIPGPDSNFSTETEETIPTTRIICTIVDEDMRNPETGEYPADSVEVTDKDIKTPGKIDAKCAEILPHWNETEEKNMRAEPLNFDNFYYRISQPQSKAVASSVTDESIIRRKQLALRRGDNNRRVSLGAQLNSPRREKAYLHRSSQRARNEAFSSRQNNVSRITI